MTYLYDLTVIYLSYMYCLLYHAPNSTSIFTISFPWCLLPSKDHFFPTLQESHHCQSDVLCSLLQPSGVSATQPRAASEKGNLGEGWWYRAGRQSQPRQKRQREVFLDLLLLWFSCLYITTSRNHVLSRCLLEPCRQLWAELALWQALVLIPLIDKYNHLPGLVPFASLITEEMLGLIKADAPWEILCPLSFTGPVHVDLIQGMFDFA